GARRGRRRRRGRPPVGARGGRRGLPILTAAAPGGCRGRSLRAARVTVREVAEARRTHKAFGPEPVPRETLLELLSLARLAPNHHLTQPWRFRVLGPATLARLQEAAGQSE